MTSPGSTAFFSESELAKLLNYVREIKHAGGMHGFSACVVGKSGVFHLVERSLSVFQAG